MKDLFAVVFLFLAVPGAQAAWTLSPAETLPASAGVQFERRTAEHAGAKVELHVVRFSPKTHTFAVMDNPQGAYDLGSAAEKRGAVAAVNGGYFHPDNSPLGLVVRKGVTIHPFERAKLLSGLVVVAGDRPALLRSAEFKGSAKIKEALQAGPFLIDRGKPVAGLNDTRTAARTVAFADGNGEFGLLTARNATLAQTAQLLAAPELRIQRALNLDGGSSTALWVKQDAKAYYSREWKGVRNYLAIVPR